MIAWFLLASTSIAASPRAPTARPDIVADMALVVTPPEEPTQPAFHVVLVSTQVWPARGVAPADRQLDPISTALTPAVERDPTAKETIWLQGYRLGAHDVLGDTLLTFSLLLERGEGDAVTGYWHEDHMAVPTSLYDVTGSWSGRTLDLKLVERVDPGIPPTVGALSGAVRDHR